MHDTAYGMTETHMSGTERYKCQHCGNSLFKLEGEKMGLKFVCD
jgi:transposase-like protein